MSASSGPGQPRDRYDAYPYPERSPADETTRLLTGSPSSLFELDHHVFGGRRDWSAPFRVLVAGGGTGDGLIMMAQQLGDAGVPHEIVYLDRSAASRDVAAKRAEVRNLRTIAFVVGDLLTADGLGQFDYIDCCGVLHHLDDPLAGAKRLAAMLRPDGGLGGMVYAPLGRTGVYPLQSAFATLLGDLPYGEQITAAKAIVAQLPKTNWLVRNPFVADHRVSDAGLFDLLLHTVDRPFWSDQLIAILAAAGLTLQALIQPIKYDPGRYLPPGSAASAAAQRLDFGARCRLAEELVGSMKKHIFYARPSGAPSRGESLALEPDLVPHLVGVKPEVLADHINRGNETKVAIDGFEFAQRMHRRTAVLVRRIDGQRPLGELMNLAGMSELEPDVASDLRFLIDANQLHFSMLKG